MPAATSKPLRGAEGPGAPGAPVLSIADLVLLRVAAAPASRAELQRDLAALVVPKIPGTVFRRTAEMAIGTHVAQQLISEAKSRLTATAAGLKAANSLIALGTSGWDGVCRTLLCRALGLGAPAPAIDKAFDRPEGLAALVLQQHFKLPIAKVLSPTTLRAELAVVALERAFGNKIKTGLGKGSGLPGKAGRVLAGQLFKSPREVATDGKLILALAAEISGATDQSLEALRLAVLRRLTVERVDRVLDKARAPSPTPDNDAAPLGLTPALTPRTIVRPDMAEFSGAVIDAARPVSEGWPGNRKAFISLVWKAIRSARPEWELSEIVFKSMLAEAHRSGAVVLAGADLKDKCNLKELEDSKILYKNTVWHFVRVED